MSCVQSVNLRLCELGLRCIYCKEGLQAILWYLEGMGLTERYVDGSGGPRDFDGDLRSVKCKHAP